MNVSQLAINSVSTRGSLEEKVRGYHEAGFERVEFVLSDVKGALREGRTPADVRRLLDQYRLECVGGFEGVVVCFGDESSQEKSRAEIVENARILSELGGTVLVVGTDGPKHPARSPDLIGDIAKVFEETARRIRACGITLCIEFNWSPVVKSLRTAVEIAARSGMENVGVLFDPAHYHCTPTKPEQINAESVPYIKHVHVNDMRDKPGEFSHCNADRVLPGEGCLDLLSIFGALERCGYRGSYSIEMFSDDLWNLPPAVAAKRMYDSLISLCAG